MRNVSFMLGPLAACSIAASPGCAPEGWGPEALSRGSGDIDDETLALGRESYEMYCSGCHGLAGDGDGPAAAHLDPKPRDFRVGMIKFARVPAGQQPHDDDYVRIIEKGLAGTAMPAFPFIPVEEKRAIVAYLRSFTSEAVKPGTTISIPSDPFTTKPDYARQLGEQVYHGFAECNACHPAYATKQKIAEHRQAFDMAGSEFRADLYEPEVKDSDWGAPIRPPDFLVDRIKTGATRDEIVYVIAAGVSGTAMPTWGTALNQRRLWATAYYVESLAAMRGMPEARALKTELASQESAP